MQSPSPTSATPTASPPPTGAAFTQAWATAPLTDVTTGEQFRLAYLATPGKVVFVETMAIWCPSCRGQLQSATQALGQIDPAAAEWVAIDVEASETAEALAAYSDSNGFPFRHAIADASMARALAAEFGDVVLSPPSVNVIVMGGDGAVTHLRGHHSPEEIAALVAEHGG
jgi:thiol-disulfide isomerase/thioredoxin